SPSVTCPTCLLEVLVLQVPVRALLNGVTVTLRCRSWRDTSLTWVSFYHEEKEVQLFRDETELSLTPLQLHHSGRYRCRGCVHSQVSRGWKQSAPVTVTVQGEHPTFAPPI
ncbi:FCGR2 protein, partial [Polioptila caerulea]|nr:FCGR2 protein [Polioptila caerulea]